jgi:hypothetical protein
LEKNAIYEAEFYKLTRMHLTGKGKKCTEKILELHSLLTNLCGKEIFKL